MSLLSIKRYLDLPGGEKHIRNEYPQDSLYGIDHYGTFPRYMNVLSTFLACGYLAADDTIEERSCPAELGGYVMETSARFGKVFAAAAGQSVEYALLADRHHEAPGLGRYHRAGAPAELGLSMPFTATPSYLLSENRVPFSVLGPNPIAGDFEKYVTEVVPSRMLAISSGYLDGAGNRHLLCQEEDPGCAAVLEQSVERAAFRVEWPSASEEIALDEKGLHILCRRKTAAEGAALWAIPLLAYNGREYTVFETGSNRITVTYGGWKSTLSSEATLILTDEYYGNRNGIYRVAYIQGDSAECRGMINMCKL